MPEETSPNKMELGRWGESYVAKYLEEQGHEILARNVRTPYGEIDIVARIKDRLIFIEVKTRTSLRYGYPEDAITEEKMAHMVDSAESYLQEHPDLLCDWQIDVIAVQVDSERESPRITHFENAIT
jgi:putative endonuclease